MPNLEELIKIREEAIKEYQKQFEIETTRIEKFIRESSARYYTEYVISYLTKKANERLTLNMDLFTIQDCGKIVEKDNDELTTELFNKIPFNNTFSILNSDNYFDHINIENDPIYYFTGKNESDKWFLRLSYIEAFAKNYNYSFEKIEPEGVFDVGFEVIASLPKLELPKHKVLSIKD